MEIKCVSVSVSRTVSLPEYSNMRFGLSLNAELEEGEEAHQVANDLRDKAIAYVEEECNKALEREGEPAKFYDGLRYDVIIFLNTVFIKASDSTLDGVSHLFYTTLSRHPGHRWSYAVTLAERTAVEKGMHWHPGNTLIGEPEAVRAKLYDAAVQSESVAMVNLGRVREKDEHSYVYHKAIIPAAEILFNSDRYSYRLFTDNAMAEGYYDHDGSNVYIHTISTVEELDTLLEVYNSDFQGESPF